MLNINLLQDNDNEDTEKYAFEVSADKLRLLIHGNNHPIAIPSFLKHILFIFTEGRLYLFIWWPYLELKTAQNLLNNAVSKWTDYVFFSNVFVNFMKLKLRLWTTNTVSRRPTSAIAFEQVAVAVVSLLRYWGIQQVINLTRENE